MSDFETLMQMSDGDEVARPSKSLWSIDLNAKDNEEDILKWLNGELGYLIDEGRERRDLIRRNKQLYRGIQYDQQEVRRDLQERTVDKSQSMPKIVINLLYDMTQARVSRLMKFKPAVAILPTNNEFEDKQAASATKDLLEHIWYLQDFEGVLTPKIGKIKSIEGESYLWIDWDADAGDIHPDSPKDGERVPLLDETGKQAKDDAGNKIWIEGDVKTGDVRYQVLEPVDVYPQEVNGKPVNPNYVFRKRIMSVEDARLLWPESADKIKASNDTEEFDDAVFKNRKLVNEVVIWEFYHAKTKGMPKGRKIVFIQNTDGALLENTEHPFSHGKLPYVRLTDIDMPGFSYGLSFFETVKALTTGYNNLSNMILRNQIMVAHPKWMVPLGAVNMQSLGNDITIVQYKGAQPPVLAQANPTPGEIFQYRSEMKEEAQVLAGVRSIGRADPPQGIKSGVALQFLNEQEQERANEDILKWNEFIKQVAVMTLAVAGDYYQAEDKRMVRVLGKDNEWKARFFDQANLQKPYDIRIQNSSALPQSKAARTQTLMDLSEKFPEVFTPSQVIDMLELAQNDKFVDDAAASLRSAQAENEAITSGDKTAGVAEYEDHIAHWKEHVTAISKYSYKETVPKNRQKVMEEHILTHEMYMWQQAKKNPAFQEQLGALKRYPVFFAIPTPGAPPVEEAAPPAGAGAGGAFQPPAELPVNPALGGEPQLPTQETLPPLEVGGEGAQPAPAEPPPIAPTSGQ